MAKRKKKKRNTPPPVPKNQRTRSFPHYFGLICLLLISLFCSVFVLSQPKSTLSLSREDLKRLIAQDAAAHQLSDHLDELYAIVQVESNWGADDVFQSSESLGLPPNTLGLEASIDQGCTYYRALLDRAAELGVDQDAVFQAYNYGIGYLDFVAENGGIHTSALAEEFSRIHSEGRIVSYPNPIAVNANGGWRYDYGNMFYVPLIHQALNRTQ